MKFKPYPEYKESGVPWLGKVPGNWEIQKGRHLFRKMKRPVSPKDDVVTCFRDGIVTLRKNRRIRGFTEALKEIGYQGIRKGDLIIHQMDAFAGAVGVSDSNGKGTPVYSVCLPINPDFNTKYYAHIVREMSRSGYILALAKGIRERSTDFRFDTFASQLLPSPPCNEQTKIARFLDFKSSQISRFIRAKKRMIELLKEQKQAIFNDTITGKIDVRTGKPYPKYKESGVEWLGKVAEDWSMLRLRFVSTISTGDKDTVDRVDDGEYPFFVRSQKVERLNTYTFDGEAVLTAGDGAGVGKVFHYYNGKLDYHQRVYKFSHFKHISGKYFFYYMRCNLYKEVIVLSAKSTVDSLRYPMLQNFIFAFPSSLEQDSIVKFIEEEEYRIDLAISRIQSEISLIQEYRTRLIADVVTGKIDVRDIVVPETVQEDIIESDVAEEPEETAEETPETVDAE